MRVAIASPATWKSPPTADAHLSDGRGTPLVDQERSRAASTLALLALVLILIGGALVRARGLATSLFSDEAFHVVAAESILEGHGARIAPEYPYKRALPFTYAVALSMRLFGDIEWAARLPAFVGSLASLLLVYLVGRTWFGLSTGLLAAAIMAFEPQSILFGSFARFYSATQFLILLAAYAFERALAHIPPERALFSRAEGVRPVRATAAWLSLFVVSLIIALWLHVLAADLILGIGLFLAIRVAWTSWSNGLSAAIQTTEAVLAGMLVAILLGGAALASSSMRDGWDAATSAGLWNLREEPAARYYAYFLREQFPFEWFLLPLGILAVLRSSPRPGLLTACIFLSTLVVHSLVFEQKSPRYFFFVMPFFFLMAASAMVSLLSLVGRGLGPTWPMGLKRVAAGLFLLFALVSSPWFLKQDRGPSWVDWRDGLAPIRDEIAAEDFVVAGIADDMFAVRRYLGRADAHLGTKEWVEERNLDRYSPPALAEGPYGIPCLGRAEEILAALENHPRIWVILRTRNIDRPSPIFPHEELSKLLSLGRPRSLDAGRITVVEIERARRA